MSSFAIEKARLSAAIVAEMDLNAEPLDKQSDPDGEIAAQMALICYKYEMNASDLVAEWSAFQFNHKDASLKNLDIFDDFIKASQTGISDTLQQCEGSLLHVVSEPTPTFDKEGLTNARTSVPSSSFISPNTSTRKVRNRPPVISESPSVFKSPEAIRYQSRNVKDKDKNIAVINAHLSVNTRTEHSQAAQTMLRVLNANGAKDSRFCFQYQNLHDVTHALNERMVKLSNIIRESISESFEFSPLTKPNQDIVWVFGRVCKSSLSRLHSADIVLQGDIELSGGAMVSLDLTETISFALFEGQILVIKGYNPSGECIIVDKIFANAPSPKLQLSREQHCDIIEQTGRDEGAGDLHVVVASGPFNLTESEISTPLRDILEVTKTTVPDILLLLGPFVQAESTPEFSSSVDPDVTFSAMLREINESILNQPTRVLIVPSINDLHHHPVFPQPPFSTNVLFNGDKITFLPNPCVIQINEVTFGISTGDIVLHLSQEEISRNSTPMRMARICTHLIQQNSFYPLYPSKIGSSVDITHMQKYALQLTPDFLVLSSKQNPFAQKLEEFDTIALNPGSISKGKCSFARLHIARKQENGPQLVERCRVEIRRI